MRIGVDLDGVLYQWERTARYLLRERLPNSPYDKTGPLGQESTGWNYIQDHVSPEHWNWLWTEGIREGMFRHGHLYKGAVAGMRELAELGDLIVITHRPKTAVNDTLAWLSYHGFPLSGVHVLTNQEPKSGVPCDAYIDDKVENCMELVATRALTAMPARRWNMHLPANSGVEVIGGVEDFSALIRRELK